MEGSLKKVLFEEKSGKGTSETHVSTNTWVSFKYLLVKYLSKLLLGVIGMDFMEELTFQDDEEDFDSDGDSDEDSDSGETDEE